MDLNEKDTNELSNILADEVIGSNPSYSEDGSIFVDDGRDDERGDKIKRFVSWMIRYQEFQKNFQEEHTLVWHNMREANNHIDWLIYYKSVLIKEIRNIKLKKLIK